jgi:hypothetical protein
MNRLTGLLLACFFAAILMAAPTSSRAQTKDKSAPPEECVLTREDYAVYSAVLLDRGKPEDPEERWDDKPDLIISDITDSGEDGKSGMWGFRSASKQRPSDDTVAHFNLRRQGSCHLKPQLDTAISYHFLPGEEQRKIFKKKGVAGGWKDFYKRYPKSSGYWNFSTVGYDANGTEALVYVGHHCGGLCGTGHLVLLAKKNDRWIVKNRVMLWIS